MNVILSTIRGCLLLITFLSAILTLVNGDAHADNERVIAFAGRIAGDENSTRVLIDFDRSVDVKTFYMDQPDRIIIDLPETVFNLGDDSGMKPRGLVSFIRFGSINEGLSRIVLSLRSPAKISGVEIKPRTSEAGFRLVVDIDKVTASEFTELVNTDREEADKTLSEAPALKGEKPAANIKDAGKLTIILDPGHGGIDGGAVGKGGVLEKDIVLSFSRILKEILEQVGPFNVLMSRNSDDFVRLSQRLDFSRNNNADLFISVHADSLKQRSVRGSTIYTLSKKASDRLSEQLAESENSVDLVAGLSLEKDEEAIVTDILADLTTRETKQFSRQFSSLLLRELEDRVTMIKNPRRSASFNVLMAPEVPGILLELGYLSNPEDEKLLASVEWQEKIAGLVSQAVVKFFEPRLEN